MSSPSPDFATQFSEVTANYCKVRLEAIIQLLGEATIVQALDEREIGISVENSLEPDELEPYLEGIKEPLDESLLTTAEYKYVAAKVSFDENTTALLEGVRPGLQMNVDPSYLSLGWFDAAAAPSKDAIVLLKTTLTDMGEVHTTRRSSGNDKPPRKGDEELVRRVIAELGRVTPALSADL